MAISAPSLPNSHHRVVSRVPPLENGDRLTASEFLRRFEAMPGVKKAELVGGFVVMASPVRTDVHADPDHLVQGWLFNYSLQTPGTRGSTNGTVRLGPDEVPQPDATLRLLPEYGGQTTVDDKGYLRGAPELVVEIAASSVSIDTRAKLEDYRRAGVKEYVVLRVQDAALDWWMLEEERYVPLPPHRDGSWRSQVFPGLWLDGAALIAADGPRLMKKLQDGLKSKEHAAWVKELKQRPL
jgi:Uma2 family endonuclease